MIRTSVQVHDRLKNVSETTVGVLYGISNEVTESPLVLELTGNSYDKKTKLQILKDVLPVGLDPIGVFLSIPSNQEWDEDPLKIIETLLLQLPEEFLETNNPVVFLFQQNILKGYIHVSSLEDGKISLVTEEEIKKEVVTLRVKGQLSLTCRLSEVEIRKNVSHLLNKVTCPYGAFHLENSSVFYLHQWKKGQISSLSPGWSIPQFNEAPEEKDSEECFVTNISESDEILEDLWKYVEKEIDDGFGAGDIKKKKNSFKSETMNFKLVMKMSGDAYTSRTLDCAPLIYEDKNSSNNLQISINLDTLGLLSKNTKILDVMAVLKGSVQRQIYEIGQSILSEFCSKKTISTPEIFHFKSSQNGCHILTIIYSKSNSCSHYGDFRKRLHKVFLLPIEKPVFRRNNHYVFEEDKPSKGPLINIHEHVKRTGPIGKLYLVSGNYAYYHYSQDGARDEGWGCAYRSLQTIISWFAFQGYTGTRVPTHEEIQKCLVDIGDKESSFKGSQQWIGSTEVGFVLETSLGVQSKIHFVSSGSEMKYKAKDVALHFETHGTPIMIGGGVLAHTILGIDWNEESEEVKWLILDPHYTGNDWNKEGRPNIAHILTKGGCGWKTSEFWTKNAFYNMCMPLRPCSW